MGHLGHLKQEYRSLLARLGDGTVALPEPHDPQAWAGMKDILEILYTPEEAALAARMPALPTSLDKLAARLGETPEALKPRLDAMCDKGVVMDFVSRRSGRAKYMLSPPVVGFIEFSMMRAADSIPKRRMAEALEAYMHGDDSFVREIASTPTTLGRALAHEGDEPLPDVLPWERATSIIEDASHISVSLCYCRHKAQHLEKVCDAPVENCLSVNAGGEFVSRRGFGRAIERGEALELLAQAREAKLVHIADNVMERPTFICNCCGCCCGQLQCINVYDLPGVTPSGYLPASDEATCSGCGRCARACPVAAITMQARRADARRKNELHPAIDEERCIGCGVCTLACKKGVMTMHRRAEQPRVPRNVVEKAIRTALEKGRLAQLVGDVGEGRGARFLQQVVQALLALPPAKRLLASEQLQSRFVRFALARIQDPTRA